MDRVQGCLLQLKNVMMSWRTPTSYKADLTVDDVVKQARTLCKDYVNERLKRSNLHTKKLALVTHVPNDIEKHLFSVGQQFEDMHRDIYSEVSSHLRMTMSSEANVKKAFDTVSQQIFKTSVTWGKVVSLFALAGVFAADCVRQGHGDFVYGIVECFVECINKHAADWIFEQGGWIGFVARYQPQSKRFLVWLLSGLGVVIGFSGTLFVTLHV